MELELEVVVDACETSRAMGIGKIPTPEGPGSLAKKSPKSHLTIN